MLEFLRKRLLVETKESEKDSIRASIKLFAQQQGVELLASDLKEVHGVDHLLKRP